MAVTGPEPDLAMLAALPCINWLNCGLAGVAGAARVGLVDLALAGEERCQHGNAHAATQVTDEVADAGDLVAHVAGDSDVAEDADGDEDECQARHLVAAPQDHGAEIEGQAEVGG